MHTSSGEEGAKKTIFFAYDFMGDVYSSNVLLWSCIKETT